MPISLSVHIYSDRTVRKQNIRLLNSENWSEETEIYALEKLLEIFKLLRPGSSDISLNIRVLSENPDAITFLINKYATRHDPTESLSLTKREREIISLIKHGYTTKRIAEKLFISSETVKTHRRHILIKTGTNNTAALLYHLLEEKREVR